MLERRVLSLILLAVVFCATARAGTLTVNTNIVGSTPSIVGYDSGHFYPGGNTIDWWRYSGVTGARIFVSPAEIEPTNDFPAIAKTVTSAAAFLNLKAAVRANPWNTTYLNWSYVTNRLATYVLTGSDYIQVDYALSNLQQLGIQTVIDSTAATSEFNISTWPGQWQLWQYYYQQAFYLGYAYNVQRYQMYNEPDDGGPTGTNYLTRLQLASDAIQSAIADVNAMYGKSLAPMMLAPVTAGGPTSTFPSWGKLVVTNQHVNFLGQTDDDFDLIQKYDYHEYGGSPPNPSTFANNLTYLEGQLATTMSPEPAVPVTISEFNVYDGSEFNSLTTTLDTPLNYSAFGAIAVNLMENGIDEIYCFKISQTVGSGYPAKNGTHFVDNTNAPYNIGGITKGGEVWRLINKGFAPGRSLLGYSTDSQTSALNLLASYDPAAQVYHLLSVNNTTSAVPLTVNLGAWNIPANNQVLVEGVNETCYGAGYLLASVGNGASISTTQGSNSVLLFTIPALQQQAMQTLPATAVAQVADGVNKNINYSGVTNLVVANNSTNAAYRRAALLQFQVPQTNLSNLQMGLLTLNASSLNGTPTNECYVYGIVNNNWSPASVTWAGAPNLAQNIPPGTAFTNNFVLGAGSNAFLLGQLVAGATPGQYIIDVTSFLKSATNSAVSFLLARQVRFLGDDQDGGGVVISPVPALQLISTLPTAVSLRSPQRASTNGISFTLQGPIGFSYEIQSSTNLTDWSQQLVVSNTTGSVQVYIINPPSATRSYFYRAVFQP